MKTTFNIELFYELVISNTLNITDYFTRKGVLNDCVSFQDLQITIEPVNEFYPTFNGAPFTASISEV